MGSGASRAHENIFLSGDRQGGGPTRLVAWDSWLDFGLGSNYSTLEYLKLGQTDFVQVSTLNP